MSQCPSGSQAEDVASFVKFTPSLISSKFCGFQNGRIMKLVGFSSKNVSRKQQFLKTPEFLHFCFPALIQALTYNSKLCFRLKLFRLSWVVLCINIVTKLQGFSFRIAYMILRSQVRLLSKLHYTKGAAQFGRYSKIGPRLETIREILVLLAWVRISILFRGKWTESHPGPNTSGWVTL